MSIIIGRAMGPMGGGGTDGWVPEFDLWDDFTTAEAAPLASPRTCEPGGGTLTLVQTDGQFSIANGALAFPAQSTAAYGDLGLYTEAITRSAGRTLVTAFELSSTGESIWGLATAANASYTNQAGVGASLFVRSATLNIMDAFGSSISLGIAAATATTYAVAIVMRSAGNLLMLKTGSNDPVLLWVGNVDNTATVYARLSNLSSVGTLSTFRVLDLPAPFNTDYGIATNRIAGAVSAGATFTHEANCLIEWVHTNRGSTAPGVQVRFRAQDANNSWEVSVTNGGTITLWEVIGGAYTSRASVSIVVADGHRIVVIADGTTIRVYSNNTLRITYASATNFATETDGKLQSLGTGGAVSDVVSWPRTLSGQAKTLLDAAIDA